MPERAHLTCAGKIRLVERWEIGLGLGEYKSRNINKRHEKNRMCSPTGSVKNICYPAPPTGLVI